MDPLTDDQKARLSAAMPALTAAVRHLRDAFTRTAFACGHREDTPDCPACAYGARLSDALADAEDVEADLQGVLGWTPPCDACGGLGYAGSIVDVGLTPCPVCNPSRNKE